MDSNDFFRPFESPIDDWITVLNASANDTVVALHTFSQLCSSTQ